MGNPSSLYTMAAEASRGLCDKQKAFHACQSEESDTEHTQAVSNT
jgi:hypothetical protein